MSDQINDGGQAFPSEEPAFSERPDVYAYHPGMTLRDYIAVKAMPMLAAEFYRKNQELTNGTVPELCASVAYQFADAMLKARSGHE